MIEIPKSFSCTETVSDKEALKLTVAITKEIESLHKNQTELVKSPSEQKIIRYK